MWTDEEFAAFDPKSLDDYLERYDHGNGCIDEKEERYDVVFVYSVDEFMGCDVDLRFRTKDEAMKCAKIASEDERVDPDGILINHLYEECLNLAPELYEYAGGMLKKL